jgi:hypothetical protein
MPFKNKSRLMMTTMMGSKVCVLGKVHKPWDSRYEIYKEDLQPKASRGTMVCMTW